MKSNHMRDEAGSRAGEGSHLLHLKIRPASPAPFIGGSTMEYEEIRARYKDADMACFEFISASLADSILDGGTDVEVELEDAPEILGAENAYRNEESANALALLLRTI